MSMAMGELWSQVGSLMATAMFVWAIVQQYFPYQLRGPIEKYSQKMVGFLYPYIQITFPEYEGERLRRSEAFSAIQNYLSTKSSGRAKRLKAEVVKDSKSVILSMDDNEEITDEYEGVKIWWTSRKNESKAQTFSFYPASDEKRFFKLSFHRRHRDIITGSFINHIMEEGKAAAAKNRQRKLFMNNSNSNGWKKNSWNHVPFEHPASFDTLAMDPKKKQEIINDLQKFKNGKDYYKKVGKAWKRGYLLYGPPGTGKSTMVAAMANFMEYDVYDLELTSVKDNTELKKFLIEISSKAIIVIEDIDCSLDLTGQRKKKKTDKDDDEDKEKNPVKMPGEDEKKDSKVTLSGLLNFIDGIWSACGGERIIIFTTNYVEKLDPALIRRGRMDKHIEMSYCSFEAFKVLAMNYLDVECHDSFEKIRQLLDETNMTPADVAENLMPKSETEEADDCLERLIEALESAKEEAEKKKAEEEEEEAAKSKAEKEKEKKEEEEEEEEEEEKATENSAKDKDKCNGVAAKENGHIQEEKEKDGSLA